MEQAARHATASCARLRDAIRDIPDFPSPGILFRDITPLLADAAALDEAVNALAAPLRNSEVELVFGAEARGFILGAALARELGAGFVPARKRGRLPSSTVMAQYALEYGTDELHVHSDGLAPGARVLVHDDLLATGGTARALCELVGTLGAEVVACSFLIELSFLSGRETLAPHDVHSVIDYQSH